MCVNVRTQLLGANTTSSENRNNKSGVSEKNIQAAETRAMAIIKFNSLNPREPARPSEEVDQLRHEAHVARQARSGRSLIIITATIITIAIAITIVIAITIATAIVTMMAIVIVIVSTIASNHYPAQSISLLHYPAQNIPPCPHTRVLLHITLENRSQLLLLWIFMMTAVDPSHPQNIASGAGIGVKSIGCSARAIHETGIMIRSHEPM